MVISPNVDSVKELLGEKLVLVVVPARGGSKGIKLKNLRELNGTSLVALVGNVVSQLDYIARAIVSTDHVGIASAARESGLSVPFMRPEYLSGDMVSGVNVMVHALTEIERIDKKRYDIIVQLEPTSPFRTPEQVTATVEKLIRGGFDSVVTVSETDSKAHPLKQLILEEDRVSYYDPKGENIVARQQLDPTFHKNGAAYAITRECLLNQRAVIGENPSAVVIRETMVNIDTELDLEFAQFMINKHQK